ncbi:hypothetical protein IJ579_02345 [bacterium]|nr:hypothetical protein [bacterium]
MGLLVGIILRKQLNIEKSSLTWQLTLISTAIAQAQRSAMALTQIGTDYESDSLMTKKIQQREYKFKLMEEKLKLQKEEIETRLAEIKDQLTFAQSMIDNSISELFSFKVA